MFTPLSSLLLVQAVVAVRAMVPPAGHDAPLCSAKSEAPSSMTVRGIRYRLEDPPTNAELYLELINAANNVTTRCDLSGSQLTPGLSGDEASEELWTACEDRPKLPSDEPRYYAVATDVFFNRTSTRLVINQTWYCDDVNPEYPIAFKGTSETTLPNLACASSNSTGGFVEECTAPDTRLSIYQYWRDDLPPYALENPIPNSTHTHFVHTIGMKSKAVVVYS